MLIQRFIKKIYGTQVFLSAFFVILFIFYMFFFFKYNFLISQGPSRPKFVT